MPMLNGAIKKGFMKLSKRKHLKIKDQEQAEKLSTCNMCGNCCSYGSGYVLKHEIPSLADHFKISEKEFTKKYLEKTQFPKAMRFKIIRLPGMPYGKCVFLKNKECSIQDIKPLHCRIGTCNEYGVELSSWYMDNYLNDDDIKKYGVSMEVNENGRKD